MKNVMNKRMLSWFTALALGAGAPTAVPVSANVISDAYITDICLAGGEDAADTLQDSGYRVYPASLNLTAPDDQKVYLGYKTGSGDPVTNVIISDDKGDSFTADDGFDYIRAGEANEGCGIADGFIYYTTDAKAGEPLEGFDLLKADAAKEEVLYAIPNDGAEVVRRADGSPADLEPADENLTVYMAQIRDGLVKPYISKVAVVTGNDEYDAVYNAACSGYNYYIEGDIEDGDEGYTMLAYERTQDVKKALTDLIGVSAETVSMLEEEQIMADENKTGGLELPADMSVSEEVKDLEQENAEEKKVKAKEQNAGPAALAAAMEAVSEIAIEADAESDVNTEAAAGEEQAVEPDPAESITESVPDAVPEDAKKASEDAREARITADAIRISGMKYARISDHQIGGVHPCFLYATRNTTAGNPITMLYNEELSGNTEVVFGTWAYGRFTFSGDTNAHIYAAHEDLLKELKEDKAVYVHYPVYVLDQKDGQLTEMKKADLARLPIAVMEAKDGEYRESLILNGLNQPKDTGFKNEKEEMAQVEPS